MWLDGDGELFEIHEGRLLKLTGAEDSSMESQYCAGREKNGIDHEIEILTYLDDGHCVLL